MSDIESLHVRLRVVEDKVVQLTNDGVTTRYVAALADRDVSDYKAVLRGQTSVLNALRETQIEHGGALAAVRETLADHSETLADHSETLADHGETLAKHGETLANQGEMLAKHGEMLANQGEMLANQGEMLANHGEMLANHGEMLANHGGALETLVTGQAAILRHLGIADQSGEGRPGRT